MISTRLVVTAAHCIQEKNSALIRKAEEANFLIGKHNIDSLQGENNHVLSGVVRLEKHPDWNYLDDRYDADIAIAVLLRTIEFTKYVRPICLWTGTDSYRDLVGKKAVVAGYGKTELTATTSSTPMWVSIPIVDTNTCLASNYKLGPLISERTFCAGDTIRGTGPCNGDSGKTTK